MNDQCFSIIHSPKQRSVDLMDQFEQRNEAMEPVYTSMLLKSVCAVLLKEKRYQIDFIIKRKPYEMPWGGTGITFTKLRKEIAGHTFTLNTSDAIEPIDQMLKQLNQNSNLREIRLEPVILKAQTSWNRSGYGPGSRGGHLYGETSPYVIEVLLLREQCGKQRGSRAN